MITKAEKDQGEGNRGCDNKMRRQWVSLDGSSILFYRCLNREFYDYNTCTKRHNAGI